MQSNKIQDILPRFILDSRGNPTVEVDIILHNNIMGRAAVPSGASTGKYEAVELRDKNKNLYLGRGVNTAIDNINNIIKPLLIGSNVTDLHKIDEIMLNEDGSDNKKILGANAILAVSLGCLRAAANLENKLLFQYINKIYPGDISMPMPMMNILNGGAHANNNLDIQEFMIFPVGVSDFNIAIQSGVEIFHTLKKILIKKNYNTNIGDEGGFAPSLANNEEAIELILEAISAAGYVPGKEIAIALDVAASELYNEKHQLYYLNSGERKCSSGDLIDYYRTLCSKYPIISIEDGLDENDWEGWKALYKCLSSKIQLVGDDLTVTNYNRLKKAIKKNAINAILIKLNQIGTFTETMQTIQLAKDYNLGIVISHRSGETEDTTIADLSVAINSGQIKTGSLCRTDRNAKYNQLLRINESSEINYANYNFLGCAQTRK